MSSTSDWIAPGPEQLKALTHPVRVRMLGLLRIDGPATATSLAQRLGLNTGATSYHLRQLAQHGFVEDDPDRPGTGRERWWRATAGATRTAEGDADPDVTDAYLQSVVSVLTGRLQEAVEERPLLPPAWRAATSFNDWVVRLSPARAEEVRDRILALLEQVAEEEGPDAEQVVFQTHTFPLPGRVAPAPEHRDGGA